MCLNEDILAFADDMLIITESYSELRDVMKRLEKQLGEGNLQINRKKSEILSTRNANLPDSEIWDTDDEDTKPLIKNNRP